jgi:hypothetical protein
MVSTGSVAFALAAVCLADLLDAQRTWVVAPSGGDFADLQTAINAASPGDTLVVRGGSYGIVFVDRSLQLVGDQPRPVVGVLFAWPGTSVSVSAVDCNSLVLPACTVALEDVTATSVQLTGTVASFARCTFDCRNTGSSTTLLTANARAAFDRCQLYGSPGSVIMTLSCRPVPGAAALTVAPGSVAELSNTTLTGAGPLVIACLSSLGTSGLDLQTGGTARVSHSTIASGNVSVPAVAGTGTVLQDSSQFQPPFTAMTAFLPAVTGQGALPGGALSATLQSVPLLPAAMVASLGLHAPVAAPEGTAWVDLSAYVVLGIGLLDASGRMTVHVPVPPTTLRGMVVTFQGVAAPGGNGVLVASTPAMAHVL